ncbi:hypothetical protein R3398_03790 [Rossellomorea marisflavi]|uniref:hypothetical protein n=1 Tax=Rossellomorea marisflavi TaxID=189381 RepID=UPI0025B00D85|nr:hypothetical protein [Rossellomorea marisflavi]MDW4525492.1 hypothetical protein [Rossellomorea marisflavi]WJV18067.1 hypothetical protein QU593_18335 [Rossellomorea marisflavi]
MFFRNMTEEEKRNSTKASGTAFSVLLIVLLGHSVYTYVKTSETGASFTIMLVGVAVFFGSDFLYNMQSKWRNRDGMNDGR